MKVQVSIVDAPSLVSIVDAPSLVSLVFMIIVPTGYYINKRRGKLR